MGNFFDNGRGGDGFRVFQAAEGLWSLEDREGRCYLAVGDGGALLLDTGGGTCGDLATCVARLTDKPLTVVNSHTHRDHVMGDALFRDVYVHPLEAGLLQTSATLHLTREGDRFELGGMTLEVLHTPGHSIGSICLLERSRGWLLCGDLLQTHPILLDCPTSSPAQYKLSLEKLFALGDCIRAVYPCHGDSPLDMTYAHRVYDCLTDYFSGVGRAEPFRLVLPDKERLTNIFTSKGISLLVSQKDRLNQGGTEL